MFVIHNLLGQYLVSIALIYLPYAEIDNYYGAYLFAIMALGA